MSEPLKFDDFVKEQFSNYSPEVPAHIWDNIVAARRTKPKGFWMNFFSGGKFLALALMITAVGGSTYFVLRNNSASPAGDNVSALQEGKEKNAATNNAHKDVVPSNDNHPLNNNTATNPGLIANDNTVANTNGREASAKNDPSHSPVIYGNGNNNRVINDRDNNVDRTQQPHLYANNHNSSFAPDKALFKDNRQQPADRMESSQELDPKHIYSPFRFNNARELAIGKVQSNRAVKLPDCPTLEQNAAGNKTYWELYAGPDKAFENYKSYGDTASTNYLARRKASTKFASAFSAGARYTKVFNNGTSVRAGINYTQVNEKFQYFNPNEIKFVTVITTRVVIRAPGDTIYINDTLQYQQSGTRIKTTFNRYRNIDVPLVIGYELGNGKIHANINAGVIINIYSWYHGDVLDSLYQPVTITTGKSNSVYQFKNNIGVGFLAGVSVYYRMTDKLHLVLEPYFRYNLSPMSKQNLNLQQKYSIGGVRAGIRFDLK